MENLVCEYDLAVLVLGHNLVAGKWTIQILWLLNQGSKRYNELYKYFRYTSRSVFTKNLRELESAGLIKRKVYDSTPIRVEYSLTEIGKKLIPVINAMIRWSKEYVKTQKEEKTTDIQFLENSILKKKYKAYKGIPIIKN